MKRASHVIGLAVAPPPLPTRHPPDTSIPSHHPHSRKISIATTIASPPASSPRPLLSPELISIPEASAAAVSDAGPSRPSSHTTASSSSASSASRSVLDRNDDGDSRTSSEITASRPRPPISPSPSSPLSQSRIPSYLNAFGASYLGQSGSSSTLPPPSHPDIRLQEPRGITTILWAYTHLVAHFHPSNSYIPPDPLLPLRAMLLHQPVGSGSLMPSSSMSSVESVMKTNSSRWQLSFGTGTIGSSIKPSLTGSLLGLAKDLVYGGSGGSLEEERKRVWNMKDLPVLETSRSLIGVDLRLKEGESRECE